MDTDKLKELLNRQEELLRQIERKVAAVQRLEQVRRTHDRLLKDWDELEPLWVEFSTNHSQLDSIPDEQLGAYTDLKLHQRAATLVEKVRVMLSQVQPPTVKDSNGAPGGDQFPTLPEIPKKPRRLITLTHIRI